MAHPTTTTQPATLRQAGTPDIDAIADLWHRGWGDGHLGHVPPALLAHRRLDDFRQLVPARIDTTTVATIDSILVGFVTVHADEIEQIYVDATARGTGVAATLLGHGETVIKTRFDRAWLAVVAGNTRARRFYERNGWANTGAFDYPACTAGGTTIWVPACRYEKALARVAAPPAGANRQFR